MPTGTMDPEWLQELHAKATSLTTEPGPFIPLRRARCTTQLHRLEVNKLRLVSLKAEEELDLACIEAVHSKIVSIFAEPESECCAFLLCVASEAHMEGEHQWGTRVELKAERDPRVRELMKKAADMGYAMAKYCVGEMLAKGWQTEGEPTPDELRSAVEHFKDAANGCDCWVDGSCSTDATKLPHELSSHAPSRRAALRLAEAYDEGLLGTATDFSTSRSLVAANLGPMTLILTPALIHPLPQRS
jgi:hypothetical protein